MTARKRSDFPGAFVLAILLAASVLSLSACGGGGSASGTAAGGQAAIGVSMASATAFPPGTVFAPAAASLSPQFGTAAAEPPPYDNVLVAVTRIALIPSGGREFPDANGQIEGQNEPDEEGPSGKRDFLTVTLPAPAVIDLLHPPTALQAGRILGKFQGIPAGDYSKIRVYYDNVVGVRDGVPTRFHPTANYHFDVHFLGGNLAVPVAANPAGGVRFFSVAIRIVGLRYHQAGNSGNVLLRPQIFATVDAPKYLVSGVARGVDPGAGTFEIVTADNRAVPASWDASTGWLFRDGRLVSPGVLQGVSALRDTAIVDAVGRFAFGTLEAEEVAIGFPYVRSGVVDAGWLPDNTFSLRLPSDNAVYPMPDRASVFIDNALFPFGRLADTDVVADAFATARGYAEAGGIRAFWISVGATR